MTKGRFVPSSTVCDVDGRIGALRTTLSIPYNSCLGERRPPLLSSRERSRGTCSFTFGHSESAVGGSPAVSALSRWSLGIPWLVAIRGRGALPAEIRGDARSGGLRVPLPDTSSATSRGRAGTPLHNEECSCGRKRG